ncbi:MAG: glycosyltransferase family 2 protein [Flavobacteriales bacterium]|nr:glycosyltransferase family 2 protein [Flavobacteriales bacterium]
MERAKLSVVVITFNEERNIERCIRSVQDLADEVLILDSFSKDNTKHIVTSRGARFEEHAFDGHIQQKNRAWQMATHDWVLSLDADEALDGQLSAAIEEVLSNDDPQIHGYSMNRLTNYCGEWVRHSGWYPDTKMRLFRKGKGEWGGVNPHDKFDLHEGLASSHLKGDILHYSYYTSEDHYKQIEYFGNIASEELYERGVKKGWFTIYLKVFAQFMKTFFFKKGFLDGATGFTIARMSAFATYRKYVKLKQRHAGTFA